MTTSIRPIQLAKASSVKNWAKTFQTDPNPLKLNSKTGPLDDGLSDFLPTFLCARPGRTYNMMYNTGYNTTLEN
ncbi:MULTISPECIES: hypothetical protein [Actibacterium]|uniref:hypothetical protein n=1 Tax=Actibacterium TaxID=1433986 RepID=UPI00138F884F|nr:MULTISPECIES: hypothetical protein [Actibacterium]